MPTINLQCMRTKILLFVLSVGLLIPTTMGHAQGIRNAQGNLGKIAGAGGFTETKVENVVGMIVSAALSLVGLIFLVLMVYAGFTWMLAQGDEAKIDKSKEIIKACIIGLVITSSAYAITVFVTARFEASSGDGGIPNTDTPPPIFMNYCLNTESGGQVLCRSENSLTENSLTCNGQWFEGETAQTDCEDVRDNL